MHRKHFSIRVLPHSLLHQIAMWTLVILPMLGSADVIRAQAEVSAGYDLLTTDPSTTDLLGIPFLGDTGARPTFDFVAPPASANRRRAIGDTDTIVHRLQDATVDSIPGTADPVAIELVALRLVSAAEFDVDGDGSLDGKVFVTLQKNRDATGETRFDYDAELPELPEQTVLPGPRSFGEMTITFESANGGTFESELRIFADLRIGDRQGPIVCGEAAGLPTCDDFDAGLLLQSIDALWGREALPESITIRGINFSLAAPEESNPVDSSIDFWAGVDPGTSTTVCVAHGGHPDPGGLPTQHGTCRTSCTTVPISPASCRNGSDEDCNGTIDDCAEDLFGPTVQAPPDQTYECPQLEIGPSVAGSASATDNCFPPSSLPQEQITFSDFVTPRCGVTFDLDRVWTAVDDCGNDAAMPDLQQIFVVDTTDPEVSCPASRTVLWTVDTSPEEQGFATGIDSCNEVGITWNDEVIPGICQSLEITRTWTATDSCLNDSSCIQPISVRGPKDAIFDLRDEVLALGLPGGIENSLVVSLENAGSSACRGNANPAVNQIEAFITKVEVQQSAGRISPGNAAALIASAYAIIEAIDEGGVCPDQCDDDGGDNDDDDDETCPGSDTGPTVVIDGCDSGVENVQVPGGCTIADGIAECAEAAANHGAFVSCVTSFTRDLVDADILSNRGRSAIQRCAARSDLP